MEQSLSRMGVWLDYLCLAQRRAWGRKPKGPITLHWPRAKLHVFKNPWRLYREIFLHECYRPLVPMGDAPRIVDIGANIGLASLYFLTRWPGAHLRAWEPNPSAFKLLSKNLPAERFPGATLEVEPIALSTASTTLDFDVPDVDPAAVYAGLTQVDRPRDHAKQVVSVTARDAAELFDEGADLLKMDIEGHEYAVFEHALPMASRVRSMAIEFHAAGRKMEQVKHITGRLIDEGGYRMTDCTGDWLEPDALEGRGGSLLLRFAGRDA